MPNQYATPNRLNFRFHDDVMGLLDALVAAAPARLGTTTNRNQIMERALRHLAAAWGVSGPVVEVPDEVTRAAAAKAAAEAKLDAEWTTTAEKARGLRAAGWTYGEIGRRLGFTRAYAYALCRPTPPADKIPERNGSAEPDGAV
jgi:hypothetical protein